MCGGHDLGDSRHGADDETGEEQAVVRLPVSCLALAMMLTGAIADPGPAVVETISFTVPSEAGDLSPAHCKIQFVSWPHPSESVPGAIKVNAKSQCDHAVGELDLSVTLLGDNMQTLKETKTKESGKAYIFNQDTWIMCRGTDVHTFQGAAMGTSWEDGKPFVQFLFGGKKASPCSY